MRQRAMIAMALANEPKLLIADEPTTALDVTVQAQILGLLQDLQDRLGMAIIMITHDLGVVAEITDEICVMYAGRIVERASTEGIFDAPQHPYTWGLLKSIPSLDRPARGRPGADPRPATEPDRAPLRMLLSPPLPICPTKHSRSVDPRLQPVADEPGHQVACVLDPSVRSQIWRGPASRSRAELAAPPGR